MTDQPIKLNAWAINYETQIAVQGEVNSRTLSVTLIDRLGSDSYVSNAESIDRPIDLTGVTARLYIKKGDGTKTFSDGVVTDAENGKVDFELPYQASTYAGDNPCQILLTKADNSALIITGLTLHVLESNLEGAIESTDEFSALVVALNSVNAALEDAQSAVADAQEAVTDADNAVITANSAATSANNAAGAANTAATVANQAAQNAQSLYQMINPLTGITDYVTNIINGLTAFIFKDSITAQEMDNLDITAEDFDSIDISAVYFDTSAKAILGGA